VRRRRDLGVSDKHVERAVGIVEAAVRRQQHVEIVKTGGAKRKTEIVRRRREVYVRCGENNIDQK
jgi:hypothetical protein